MRLRRRRPSGSCPSNLAAVGRVAAAGGRIVGAAQLHHLAGGSSLIDIDAGDEIGVAQPDLPARSQAEVLLRRILAEVGTRSMYSTRENGTFRVPAQFGILGVVDRVQLFDLVFGVVLDHDLERPQHAHHARRPVAFRSSPHRNDSSMPRRRDCRLGHADRVAEDPGSPPA